MTTTPTLNGRIIGQAERATRALLENLLATTGIGFQPWVALTNLATASSARSTPAGVRSSCTARVSVGWLVRETRPPDSRARTSLET